MKLFYTRYAKICVLVLACSLCGACSSFTKSRSWSALKDEKITGTILVAAVKADKTGGWSSVENEAAALLPLLFLERRFKTVGEEEGADYIAELNLREREFSRGWENQASISVELRLWPAASAGERELTAPLAAGQVLLQGDESLSSSGTLVRLLRKAVGKALKALPKSQKIDIPEKEESS